jgi:hypothetical protein
VGKPESHITISSMLTSGNCTCTLTVDPLSHVIWNILANVCPINEGPKCDGRHGVSIGLNQTDLAFVPGSEELMGWCGADQPRVRNTSETNPWYVSRCSVYTYCDARLANRVSG